MDTGYLLSPDPYQDNARTVPHGVNRQVKEKVDGASGHPRTDMIETPSASVEAEAYDPRARLAALLGELREARNQPVGPIEPR